MSDDPDAADAPSDAAATGDEGGPPDESETDEGPANVRAVALAVVAGVFFGGVATGVAFPTLPLLDDLLGISAVVLGFVLAANRIARLVTNTPAGSVIDRLGARRPMIAGLFVQGLAPFGYVLGMSVPAVDVLWVPGIGPVSAPAVVFIVSRLLWGVGSAFVFLGAFATVTYVTTERNRGRWLGVVRAGQSMGFPTGLVLGGLLADLVSITAAFLTAGVLALLAAVVALFVLPDVRPDAEGGTGLRAVPALLRREPTILPIGLGNLTVRFVFGGVLLATVVKYAEAVDISVSALDAAGVSGLVLGTGVVVSSITTVASGRISDSMENRAVVTVPAFLAMVVGLVILAFVPTLAGLFGATALIGLGVGGTGPVLLALLGDVTPGSEVGRMGGVYNVMGDLGLSLGPLLAVPMVDTWLGFRATYLACAGVVLVTLVLVVLTLVRH